MPILPNGRYNIFTKGSTFLPSNLNSQWEILSEYMLGV
jgi:hypothetical protein